jgi:hypothetical protein
MTLVEKIKDLTFDRKANCKQREELVEQEERIKTEYLEKIAIEKRESDRIRRLYNRVNVMEAEIAFRQALEPVQTARKAKDNMLLTHKSPLLVAAEERLGHLIEASLNLEAVHEDAEFLMGAIPTRRTTYDIDSIQQYRAALDARRRALGYLIFIATDDELKRAIAKVESDNPLPPLKKVTYERHPSGEWRQIA